MFRYVDKSCLPCITICAVARQAETLSRTIISGTRTFLRPTSKVFDNEKSATKPKRPTAQEEEEEEKEEEEPIPEAVNMNDFEMQPVSRSGQPAEALPSSGSPFTTLSGPSRPDPPVMARSSPGQVARLVGMMMPLAVFVFFVAFITDLVTEAKGAPEHHLTSPVLVTLGLAVFMLVIAGRVASITAGPSTCTAWANLFAFIGVCLIELAGFLLAWTFRSVRIDDWSDGLFWGLAAFAVFVQLVALESIFDEWLCAKFFSGQT
ncbi:hypothetical protein V8F20_010682 [Naviculisporaceae sp. PSN 640]